MQIEIGSRWHRLNTDCKHTRLIVLVVETNHVLVEIDGSKCDYGGMNREWLARALFSTTGAIVERIYPWAMVMPAGE